MRHRFVDDTPAPSASPCTRGCTLRDRHAGHCAPTGEAPCWGCLPRPAEPGSPLCHGCGVQFGQGIAEMPALTFELWRGLAASAGGVASGSTKMDGSPDFARQRAVLEHINRVARDLTRMTATVALARGITRPAGSRIQLVTVQHAAAWLSGCATWMITRPEVAAWSVTVAEDRARAYRLIDRPPRSRFDLPDPCPGPVSGQCGARLTVTMYDVGDPRANEVWCAADPPHRWEPHQWLRLGRRLGYDKCEGGSS